MIIPAIGWAAIIETEESSIALPLVCWYMRRSAGPDLIYDQVDVAGMVVQDGKVVFADLIDGFKTYESDMDAANMDFLSMKQGKSELND